MVCIPGNGAADANSLKEYETCLVLCSHELTMIRVDTLEMVCTPVPGIRVSSFALSSERGYNELAVAYKKKLIVLLETRATYFHQVLVMAWVLADCPQVDRHRLPEKPKGIGWAFGSVVVLYSQTALIVDQDSRFVELPPRSPADVVGFSVLPGRAVAIWHDNHAMATDVSAANWFIGCRRANIFPEGKACLLLVGFCP